MLNKDVPAAVGLLKDIASQATQLTSHVHKLQERVESGELSTAKVKLSIILSSYFSTQVKIDGPVRGLLRAQNLLQARYNGLVTGPSK